MEAKDITKAGASIFFDIEEFASLSNAINEALEAVEDWEFQTRTGEPLGRAKAMQAELGRLIAAVKAA